MLCKNHNKYLLKIATLYIYSIFCHIFFYINCNIVFYSRQVGTFIYGLSLNKPKQSSYRVRRALQVSLRHPGHLSLLQSPEVQSQGVLEDPCLLKYREHLVHRGSLVLLSLAESPVTDISVVKWIANRSI